MPAFLTREFFDTLIIVIVVIGTALAAVRVYRDFTRPLPRIPAENDVLNEAPTPTASAGQTTDIDANPNASENR